MSDTRRALLWDGWLQLLGVVLLLVLGNHLAARHFARLDLTRDRVYTLSTAARHLVQRLDKPMVARVFFTRGLEAPYNNHEQVVVDKLEEFRAWSRGLLEVEVIDPTGDRELEAEARQLGIQPVQYRYRSQDRQELRQVYMGVAFIYADRQYALPAITQVDTIEYDIARAIKALLDDEGRRKVGYLLGHGEPDLLNGQGPVATLRDRILEGYELVPLHLGGDEGVPEDVDAVLVIGPQSAVTPREQYQLDQALMAGKPLAFFLANFRPDFRTLRPRPVRHGLAPMLAHYGFRLNQDLVLDRQANGQMRFPVRQGRYVVQVPVNHPLIPKVSDLAPDALVVRGLDTMLFPFASSIEVAEGDPDVERKVLARTSPVSVAVRGLRRIDPVYLKQPQPGEVPGPHAVLAAGKGTFTSFFAGRDVPDARPGESAATTIRVSAPTRLVVSGSADMVANNIPFMLNLVDWMVQDAELIEIRTKTVQVPSLEPMSVRRTRLVKLANLLGPAALFLLFAGLRIAAFRRG